MYPVQEDMSKIEAHAMKLMTTDGEKLAAELSITEIEYPCQFVVIGSAFTLGVVSYIYHTYTLFNTLLKIRTFLYLTLMENCVYCVQ